MGTSIKIEKGSNGWGGPLYLTVDSKRNKVVSITGGNIHPIAEYIAQLSGGIPVDGFKTSIPDEEILCVVINCGGTLRCGIYPQKGIPTINVNPGGPSGPLAQFMKESIYVSDVKKECISITSENVQKNKLYYANEQKKETLNQAAAAQEYENVKGNNIFIKIMMGIAQFIGKLIAMLYESGRESVDICQKTVIPFMAFVSILVALVLASGLGKIMAHTLSPIASSIWGLLLISVICGIPFLSPLLGPGAAIAQVIGVLMGTEIGLGHIPPQYALPVLFAIDVQVGADFVPVGLSMQGAHPKTIEYGVPAFLISRQFTGPLAVLIAYLFSIGLF